MNGFDDEHRLEAFFAAARTERVPPHSALYTAILADAAAVATARSPAPHRPQLPWRAATALAACAALGFWVGMVGTGDYGSTTFQSTATVSEDASMPVDGFFDLASVEG